MMSLSQNVLLFGIFGPHLLCKRNALMGKAGTMGLPVTWYDLRYTFGVVFVPSAQ